MKFTVAKREVDLRLDHIILVAVLYFALAIIILLLTLAKVFFTTGGLAPESIYSATASAMDVLLLFSAPVVAYLMLWAGGVAKMKRDAAFCRSVAAASFFLSSAFIVLFFVFMLAMAALNGLFSVTGVYGYGSTMMSGMFPLFGIPMVAGELLSFGAGAIISYLWLLFVMEYKAERMKRAAGLAAAFALVLFLLDQSAIFALMYSLGNVQALELDGSMAFTFIRDFMFAFVILYHVAGKKLDIEAAGLFAGLYLAATVAMTIDNALLLSWPAISFIADIARAIIALALLYALSRAKDITP